MTDTIKRYLPLVLMLIILWIAAGTRFHNLGVQSLWYDEGVAFGHSQRSLFELIPRLQNNVHVPAYFALLAVYEDFVGSSELALRSLSALFSILSVAATYALGKRLFSPAAGLAAASFVALNSFSIYYAQETRMYAMLSAVGALSMWVFAGFVRVASQEIKQADSTRWRRLLQYSLALVLLNTLGEYTHVSYALVMLAQGVLAILWLGNLAYRDVQIGQGLGRSLRLLLVYGLANLLTIGFFAPWLLTAISQIAAQPNVSEVVAIGEMLRILQGWLAFGPTFEIGMGGMGVVMYFLLLFGLISLPEMPPRAWWALLLPLVWVLLSSAVYLYLELYARYLRFLLPAQIAFALWMGRGIWILWIIVPRALRNQPQQSNLGAQIKRYLPKVAAMFATLAFSIGLARGLLPLYTDSAFQRDDYRALVETITQEGDDGHAIILSAPGVQEIFNYYYDGSLPVYPLPASEDIAADTMAVLNQYERIFVVLYGTAEQDPQGIVTGTLNSAAYQINSEWVGDVRLERYLAPARFDSVQASQTQFGDAIMLDSYALNESTLRPNEALQLQLQWRSTQPLQTRYKVFVQLLNNEGVLVAQRDSEPGGGEMLTTLWQADEAVLDNHALSIPADLPAGDYTLIIGLYDADDPASRLPVGDKDFLILDTIQIR